MKTLSIAVLVYLDWPDIIIKSVCNKEADEYEMRLYTDLLV